MSYSLALQVTRVTLSRALSDTSGHLDYVSLLVDDDSLGSLSADECSVH